jgi:formate hydrogenlyase subunit 3/multisubunit Na+/H+ antiporter MnhD subunit
MLGESPSEIHARIADIAGLLAVTTGGMLLFVALAAPLAMLLACMSRGARDRMLSLLALAPAPALVAALLAPAGTTLVLPEPPFRMTLVLDIPGAILLGVAALLWIVAGAYASAYLRGDSDAGALRSGGC